MKKLNAIIIAIALVLGLGQCKKQETPTTDAEGMVYITVNVDDDGAKHAVWPDYGIYAFDEGDKLYVGNNGHYVGILTYSNHAFSGAIQSPSTDDYLHFYFLGGKGPDAPETEAESFTVSIADQSGELPILSYGHSTQKYTDENATYATTLRNKCALVEFKTNKISTGTAVSISNMKTEATIDFNNPDNAIVANGITGALTLHAESATSRWAILLPGEEVTTTANANGYDETESFTVPAVSNNSYLTGTSAVSFEMTGPLAVPLTMEALSDGGIIVDYAQEGMKYSLNDGEKIELGYYNYIEVTVGDKIAFYGNGTNIKCYNGTRIVSDEAIVKLYGNIMSLVDEENFAGATTLPSTYTFSSLFSEDGYLQDASGLLLPATTLTEYCYYYMFGSCYNLETTPELPATTLAPYCYQSMFSSCTSLTTAPNLPATTLAEGCYNGMFHYCPSLETAPELPATTLANFCYSSMFDECHGLTTAPELPATTMAESCYTYMFSNCTNLSTPPTELPATTMADYCCEHMFYNCSSLTTAPELPATTMAEYCYGYMFDGCSSLTAAPELPAESLAESCYYAMFNGCTSLTTAPALPATTLTNNCYREMFYNCSNLQTAPVLPATTLAEYCYYDMFAYCSSLTTAPVLPATTLVWGCYDEMFYYCENLSSVTCYATVETFYYNTDNWLYGAGTGVSGTKYFYADPNAYWEEGSNSGIPYGWERVNIQ